MTQRFPKAERLAAYDTLLAALSLAEVGGVGADAAQFFIEDTPYEDEWLNRTGFIDGSLALLMRSMLKESGDAEAKSCEDRFGDARDALRRFAQERRPIPSELLPAVRTSVVYYRRVAEGQQNIANSLGR